MTYAALLTIYSIFKEKWSDFKFKKSKKSWIMQTEDRALLFIELQKSQWGAIYYLNFGVYYLDLNPTDEPSTNQPKSSGWHLFARYGNFQAMSANQHNILFSMEEIHAASLYERCTAIADFADKNILPRLRMFGDFISIRDQAANKSLEAVLDPFRVQNVTKEDLFKFIDEAIRMRAVRDCLSR